VEGKREDKDLLRLHIKTAGFSKMATIRLIVGFADIGDIDYTLGIEALAFFRPGLTFPSETP
jgi:hypothetical protein